MTSHNHQTASGAPVAQPAPATASWAARQRSFTRASRSLTHGRRQLDGRLPAGLGKQHQGDVVIVLVLLGPPLPIVHDIARVRHRGQHPAVLGERRAVPGAVVAADVHLAPGGRATGEWVGGWAGRHARVWPTVHGPMQVHVRVRVRVQVPRTTGDAACSSVEAILLGVQPVAASDETMFLPATQGPGGASPRAATAAGGGPAATRGVAWHARCRRRPPVH